MPTREENVFMAKLAEQAKRYEEMVEFMEKVAKAGDVEELTVEERNLSSVAYEKVIGARRASWRIISSIEQKEESRGNEDHVATIKEYQGKIEVELSKICDGILGLLESHLIPSASSTESKVERYEEMVEFMEKVAKAGDVEELTMEERNLFSIAYKNVIGARWASWRIISSIEQKEESRGNKDHVATIKEYRGKIEAELSKICDGILGHLESHLIPLPHLLSLRSFTLK
ncbi:hypothetical protein Ancab_006641 [Ancistrocladus abbreviatus]